MRRGGEGGEGVGEGGEGVGEGRRGGRDWEWSKEGRREGMRDGREAKIISWCVLCFMLYIISHWIEIN